MNKTIVLSSNSSFSLWNFRLELMEALKEKGFKVIALAPKDAASQNLAAKFSFVELKNLDRKGKNPLKELRLLVEYLRHFRHLKPDLVINFTIKPCIYGSLACSILGTPYICVITGLGFAFIRETFLTKIVSTLYKLSLRKAKKVMFLNPDDMEEFLKRRLLKNGQAMLLPSEGVNTEKFSPALCEAVPKPKKPVFLMIARMLWDKGVGELAQASKILKEKGYDFEVWLLGPIDKGNPSTVEEERIKEWEKAGLVRYLGATEDVRPFICQSSCVVLPSYREGAGRSLLEAMAMGKPIITTDSPGCREVCLDGINGFLVKPRDAESLAQAMEKFLGLSEKEREEMGKRGRALVLEKFDVKKVVEFYFKVIEKIFS